MNEIITNQFQGNREIRVIIINDKEWFFAKDTATLLGYTNPQKAIRDHCKNTTSFEDFFNMNESFTLNLSRELGNNWKQTKLISEPDVWRLVIKSKLPEAEKVEEWIMEEVLPSIRKTGSYSVEKKEEVEKLTPEKSLEIVEKGTQLLTKFRDLNPVEQIKLDIFHKNESGESLLQKFGIHFKNSYFLPTELGNFSGISGAEINLILEKKGFQEKLNGIWKPTENGKKLCLEIGNKFNQLKWKIETIF
jgi:prophage antirepressor-like protein